MSIVKSASTWETGNCDFKASLANKSRSLRDGPVVRSTHCSHAELEFISQHPRQSFHNDGNSSSKESDALFWPPRAQATTYTNRYTHIYINKNKYFKIHKI